MASCPQRVHVAKKKTPPPAPSASLVCVPFEGGRPSDPYVRAATRGMSAQRRLAGDCPPPCSARPQTNRLEAAVVPIARGPGFFAHRVRAVRPCADRRRGWSSRARLLRPEDRRQKIAPRSSKARFLPWPADRPTFRLGHGFPPPAACDGGVSRSVMCAERGFRTSCFEPAKVDLSRAEQGTPRTKPAHLLIMINVSCLLDPGHARRRP